MKQCKCCLCLHHNDLERDEKGRCGKCQKFCTKDKLKHCNEVIELNRQLGERCVTDIILTFDIHSDIECNFNDFNCHSFKKCKCYGGCFDCYWSGFPCNGCLIELFKRDMSLSDVITTSMTYEKFKKEKEIWKPHWEVPDDYKDYY